jgi:hypothetical protein
LIGYGRVKGQQKLDGRTALGAAMQPGNSVTLRPNQRGAPELAPAFCCGVLENEKNACFSAENRL